MNKKNKTKKQLSEEELNELIEEATVDCYDDYECLTGFATMIDDNLDFPFSAKVVGGDVMVTGAAEERDEILAACERKGKKYTVNILNIEFTSPVKGEEWVAAYKKWRGYK